MNFDHRSISQYDKLLIKDFAKNLYIDKPISVSDAWIESFVRWLDKKGWIIIRKEDQNER